MIEEEGQVQELEHIVKSNTQETTIEDIFSISCTYPSSLYRTSKIYSANIVVTPYVQFPNLPIQVDIRGHSQLQTLNPRTYFHQELQLTQSVFLDEDQKGNNQLMTSNPNNLKPSRKTEVQNQAQGQYFLQGCQVLSQLDQNRQRLEHLTAQKQYCYPVEFVLPANLPVSLQHKILKSIHITITYSLQIKVNYPKDGKMHTHITSIPFTLLSPPVEQHQQLTHTQQLRLYHLNGKRADQVLSSKCRKILKYICPQVLVSQIYPKQYSNVFQQYDLIHVELLTMVNQDHNIFLTLRTYKEPDAKDLISNREKKKTRNFSQINEQNATGAVAEISLTSIKSISRNNNEMAVNRVKVQLWGQLKDIRKQLIFSKTVYLTKENYDMLEGESVINLSDHLDYPHSCSNELFTLTYYFTLHLFFQDQPSQSHHSHQLYLITQTKEELKL